MQRLKYEKINNSNEVIMIDLHNGYSVIAVTGFDIENKVYITTLFLKDNTIDTWKLSEKADKLVFHANNNTINSAILKQVSVFSLKYLKSSLRSSYIFLILLMCF